MTQPLTRTSNRNRNEGGDEVGGGGGGGLPPTSSLSSFLLREPDVRFNEDSKARKLGSLPEHIPVCSLLAQSLQASYLGPNLALLASAKREFDVCFTDARELGRHAESLAKSIRLREDISYRLACLESTKLAPSICPAKISLACLFEMRVLQSLAIEILARETWSYV